MMKKYIVLCLLLMLAVAGAAFAEEAADDRIGKTAVLQILQDVSAFRLPQLLVEQPGCGLGSPEYGLSLFRLR